jgi:hypothetical protein
MKGSFLVVLILGLAAVLPPPAAGQIWLARSVNGAGGATVSNASYVHECTVGQAVVGVCTSALYIHDIGFWFGLGQPFSDAQEPLAATPIEFGLSFANANPSGSLARIAYAVPAPSHVTIRLFDVGGREISTLIDGYVEPGYHEAELRASGLGGGIYFCRMDATGFSATKKLVLIK